MKTSQNGSLRVAVLWLILIVGAWAGAIFVGRCIAQTLAATIAATRTH